MIDGAGLLTFRKPNMTGDLFNITIHFSMSKQQTNVCRTTITAEKIVRQVYR
jgi:hypothetical protein